MRDFFSGLAIFVIFAAVSFIFVLQNRTVEHAEDTEKLAMTRTPSSYFDVQNAITKVDREINNPTIFNAQTAASYINGLADKAYGLGGGDFTPVGEAQTREFMKSADMLTKVMFSIRIRLSERLRAFEQNGNWSKEESRAAVAAFRRANLYLRYAEDYAIQWRDKLQPLKNSSTFFQGEGPLSLKNPKFVDAQGQIAFKAGDVIVVRGSSFFSATIARISDSASNLSHIAMIAKSDDGRLYAVEALLETGMNMYEVNEYMKFEPLPRAVLYRFEDEVIAEKAAREAWRLVQENVKHPVPFDIMMDADDHSAIYCAEMMSMAFEAASGGKVQIPRYRTEFTKSAHTPFAENVGMRSGSTFGPSDIDVDTRFQLVMEHRDLTLLDESRRFDVVLSMLLSKFENGFTYPSNPLATPKAMFAVALRKLGFKREEIPEGISVNALATMIRHKALVEDLMAQLKIAEVKATQETKRPLSYRELEKLFNQVCDGKCVDDRSGTAVKAKNRKFSETDWGANRSGTAQLPHAVQSVGSRHRIATETKVVGTASVIGV